MGRKFLIIDDSALMRRVISDIIKQNSEYEVLDFAVDGVEGLDRLIRSPGYYDLVILDINMPKMNGLELLEMLQKNRMHEAVVVVSTVAKEGAKETMRALELGALDFVTKPENFYEVKGEGFRTHMISMIEVVTGKDLNRKSLTAAPGAVSSGSPFRNVIASGKRDSVSRKKNAEAPASGKTADLAASKASGDIESVIKNASNIKKGRTKLVAIACSTGGPKSLQQVIPLLPENLDAGVVLVQHMPKGFTASLANRLNSLSRIKVSEAADGEPIEKGHVYIAPGGMHIKVERTPEGHVIRYSDEPPVNALKPCANVMYESLKDSDFDEITCAVLTGMGADGTEGIRALSDAHKKIYVIGQDAESCVVYGMPRSIAEAGLADEVRPLEQIAESIIKNVGVS